MKGTITLVVLGMLILSLMSFSVLADINSLNLVDSGVNLNSETSVDRSVESEKSISITSDSEVTSDDGVKEDTNDYGSSKRMGRREKMMERRDNIRKNFEEARKEIKERRVKLADCRSKFDNSCKQIRDEYRKDAVEVLLNVADRMINHLENLKTKVENSEMENKADFAAQIDVNIKTITNIKAEIEGLGENPSREDIKKINGGLRTELKEVKKHTNSAQVYALTHKMGGVIVKMNHLQNRLDNVLLKLKEKNIDDSNVKAKVNDFNVNLKEATRLYADAEVKLKQGASPSEVHDLVKQSHQYLKKAHDNLKEVVKEVKNLNDGVKILAEAKSTSDVNIVNSDNVNKLTAENGVDVVGEA